LIFESTFNIDPFPLFSKTVFEILIFDKIAFNPYSVFEVEDDLFIIRVDFSTSIPSEPLSKIFEFSIKDLKLFKF
jgi:hypothetical protein